MTPGEFLKYSLIGLGDVMALILLASFFMGATRSCVRGWMETYFQEKEKFLKRLGDVSLPMDVHRSKMLD